MDGSCFWALKSFHIFSKKVNIKKGLQRRHMRFTNLSYILHTLHLIIDSPC